MPTAPLTLKLPTDDIEFLNEYARQHGLTVAEVVRQYVRRLQAAGPVSIHPEVEAITGLVPTDDDAEAAYRRHLLAKHR